MKKKFNNSPHLSIENKEDFEQMLTICKALGDRKRLTVIKELQKEPFKIGLTELARKLDSKTSIYEYSFKTEFTQKDKWVLYEGDYVAYNLSM